MEQPSNIDLLTPFDPTAFTTITGGQLEQLVGGSTPFTDKGIVMVTTDVGGVAQVPTANVTTKWQNYLWLQISPNTTSVALYAWNPNQTNANPNFLNWQPVTLSAIPALSIQGYQLAPSTITYDKILNIQLSQIVGYATLLATNTYPTVQTQISGNFALGFTINNGAVTLAMLDQTGALGKVMTAQGVGQPPIWSTPPQVYSGLANPNAGGANDGQVVAVNSGAAGTFKYPTWLQVNNSAVTSLYSAGALATNAGQTYVSANQNITSGSFVTFAHGLVVGATNTTPMLVRAVLVNTTAELGYSVGDEVDYMSFWILTSGTANYICPIGALGANATNVYFQFRNGFSTGILVAQLAATAGAQGQITAANWKLKIYARL